MKRLKHKVMYHLYQLFVFTKALIKQVLQYNKVGNRYLSKVDNHTYVTTDGK